MNIKLESWLPLAQCDIFHDITESYLRIYSVLFDSNLIFNGYYQGFITKVLKHMRRTLSILSMNI